MIKRADQVVTYLNMNVQRENLREYFFKVPI
jgi:hypothetical protein